MSTTFQNILPYQQVVLMCEMDVALSKLSLCRCVCFLTGTTWVDFVIDNTNGKLNCREMGVSSTMEVVAVQ